MDASISSAELSRSLRSSEPPLVIDVRRRPRFHESPYLVKGALWRDPERVEEWKETLPRAAPLVVYCVHGHEVSQNAAKALGARYLEGGIEAWREAGGELARKPQNSATRWVTRERPKIDRIACPWLIRRFVDPEATLSFLEKTQPLPADTLTFGFEGAHFANSGTRVTYEEMLVKLDLAKNAALAKIGSIVHFLEIRGTPVAEAAGVQTLLQGAQRRSNSETELLAEAEKTFDLLYEAYYQGPKAG